MGWEQMRALQLQVCSSLYVCPGMLVFLSFFFLSVSTTLCIDAFVQSGSCCIYKLEDGGGEALRLHFQSKYITETSDTLSLSRAFKVSLRWRWCFKMKCPLRWGCIKGSNGPAARYFQNCFVVTVVLNIMGLQFFSNIWPMAASGKCWQFPHDGTHMWISAVGFHAWMNASTYQWWHLQLWTRCFCVWMPETLHIMD